jgi:hypothetical protein
MSNIGRRPLRGYLQVLDHPKSITYPDVPFAFEFLYNPTELVHMMLYEASGLPASANGSPFPVIGRLPCELFFLSVEMDITDQLERPQSNYADVHCGLLPRLAKLQLMAKPKTSTTGHVDMPVMAFSWGPNRVVPVRLLNVKVTEEAFDPTLNPIRAKVDMWLRVLEKDELKSGTEAYQIWCNYDMKLATLSDQYLPQAHGVTL